MYVHKFGGTSLGNTKGYQNAARIVSDEPGETKVIVVSAMAGVTNRLIELIEMAKRGEDVSAGLDELERKHLVTLQELTGGKGGEQFGAAIRKDLQDVRDV